MRQPIQKQIANHRRGGGASATTQLIQMAQLVGHWSCNNKREASCWWQTRMTTQLEWQLTRLRSTRDARHKKWRVLGNQLALKGLKLILDQGEDAIARGDKLIHWWWGRLIRSGVGSFAVRTAWNDHSSATATFAPTNTSGRWDGTRGREGTQRQWHGTCRGRRGYRSSKPTRGWSSGLSVGPTRTTWRYLQNGSNELRKIEHRRTVSQGKERGEREQGSNDLPRADQGALRMLKGRQPLPHY